MSPLSQLRTVRHAVYANTLNVLDAQRKKISQSDSFFTKIPLLRRMAPFILHPFVPSLALKPQLTGCPNGSVSDNFETPTCHVPGVAVPLTVSCTHPSGTTFPVGNTAVTCFCSSPDNQLDVCHFIVKGTLVYSTISFYFMK